MRAVVFDRHGPPEVLRVADLAPPEPAAGQVRIRVRAAGIQPFDTLVRRASLPVPVHFPQQLGNEFAGVIDRIGPGVHTVAEGDPVLGWAHMRSLAEQVVTGTDAIVAKPTGMPWQEAAALGASGQTAATALRELRVSPGETLLVHAAAGGAGSAAVQLARARGAEVIGTASPHNHSYLTGLGAAPVAYGPGLVDRVRELTPNGVHAALDGVGGQALRECLQLTGEPDRVGTLVDHDLAQQLGARGIRAQRSTAQLAELTELHQRGSLRVWVRASYGLDDIAEAHRDVETGHGRGKVVVTLET